MEQNKIMLKRFKITISVKFGTPRRFTSPEGETVVAAGYFRTLTVAAQTAVQARALAAAEASDGAIVWDESSVEPVLELPSPQPGGPETGSRREEAGVLARTAHFLYP